MWLAAVPLLLIPACWLYWWAAGIHHGIAVGRSAALVLALGCVAAAFAPPGPARDAVAPRWRALLANPVAWCLAALAWQVVAWIGAPVREPGLPWLAERAAALATACAAAWWLARAELPRAAWGLAGAGAVVLLIDAISSASVGGEHLGMRLALHEEPPFGNSNFVVGAALPLLGLSLPLWLRERQSRPGRAGRLLLALGWTSALAIALGVVVGAGGIHLGGHAVRATFIGIAALVAAAAALAAPSRWHLPLAGLGLLALWGGEAAVVLGLAPHDASPSTEQRVHLWRAAAEAIAQAPLAGYGPGAAIAALPEQEAFAAAWLAVPSWAEHAHHELLELLLDGGAVNLLLIAGALAATLIPLWRRRGEAVPCALLVAWTGVVAQASVESHLSQPGPLWLLALLAGASWACAREGLPAATPEPRARAFRRAACLMVALPILSLCARELLGDPVSAPLIDDHARARLAALEQARDWPGYRDAVRALRRRLGPLDDLACLEALGEQKLAGTLMKEGKGTADEDSHRRLADEAMARAERLALEQAARLPLLAADLELLQRLRRWREAIGDHEHAAALATALDATEARCRELLEAVPENQKNRDARARLAPLLAAVPTTRSEQVQVGEGRPGGPGGVPAPGVESQLHENPAP